MGRHVLVIQTGRPRPRCRRPSSGSPNSRLFCWRKISKVERFKEEFCLKIPRRFTVQAGAPDSVRAAEMLVAKLERSGIRERNPAGRACAPSDSRARSRSVSCDAGDRYRRRARAERKSRPARELAREPSISSIRSKTARFKVRRVRSDAYRLRYVDGQCRSRQINSVGCDAEIRTRRQIRPSCTTIIMSRPEPAPCPPKCRSSASALPTSCAPRA